MIRHCYSCANKTSSITSTCRAGEDMSSNNKFCSCFKKATKMENRECNTCRRSYANNVNNINCIYGGHGDNSCHVGLDHKYWKPIQEKKYKLTEKYNRGFSLVDIMSENPCKKEFVALIEEAYKKGAVRMTDKYKFNVWDKDEVIQSNIPWLIEKGFIEEDIPEERWVNLYALSLAANDVKTNKQIYTSERRALEDIAPEESYIATIKLPDKEK